MIFAIICRQVNFVICNHRPSTQSFEMENNTDHTDQNNFSPLTVQEVDIDFLPIVYEIIRSVERDFHDNSAKARESQDCSLKVLELQKKFDIARSQVKRLPGIEYNKQDQLKQFEILRTQLQLKRELLQKYRNMCSFETSFK
ncbi:mediator of RNA polymerase II transcription subunit 9 [Bicyclus anynana]|uniref:Mediator of RNA polymerase II transcription subunit 9 n=1 Tax=Bicyclus anynana TaxID=110368 RepID=A0A6J1P5P8_BICAN|nr:mediator of RNA polymerase II transcription subunit 9 [Bicyclus anynana]